MHVTERLQHAALELHTWSKCRHPNVVELLGAAEFRDQIGMVSLWMENGSLPSFLAKHPDVDRCQLSLQISEGLAYLHYRNIIHGDLKGLNILISNTGTPLLADFGNAVLQGRTLQFTNTTPKNSISPRWAAPEIIKGSGTYSFSADVYALGMTILETITGQVPYSEKVDLAVFFAVAVNRELPKRPEGQIPLDSQQGNALWSMLTRCWAFEAETRPRADDVVDVMKTVTREALMRPTSGAVLESNAGASAVPTTRGEHLTWVARQLRETPVDSPNPTSPP